MDIKRKKELLNEWKNHHPNMGVISIVCKSTGDLFLGSSKDTKADFNSNQFKLSVKLHANQQLQKLWETYGETAFDYSVIKTLEYDNPEDDHTDKLNALLEECLLEIPQARRL